MDEALLGSAEVPTLRFYRWQNPAVTLGYFQRCKDLPLDSFGDSEIARRWTGGGLVDHRHDLPYSLIVPAQHWLSTLPATDSYRWIHQRLAQALRATSCVDAIAADVEPRHPQASTQAAMACFSSAVAWDISDAKSGRKLCGAAQRRSQRRLLHQGSVILDDHCASDAGRWRSVFAERLAPARWVDWSPAAATLEAAVRLADKKYRTSEWRKRF